MTFQLLTAPGLRRAAAAFALCSSVVACSDAPKAASPAGPPGGGMPPMPVEIITLANQPVEQTSEFVASLKSRRSTTIQPQAEGHLTRIAVRSGERVSLGAVLFEIDSAPEQSALAVAAIDAADARGRARVCAATGRAQQEAARSRRHQPARGRAVRNLAARQRGAIEGARRSDQAAAQHAVVFPRHRAERRRGRRHPGPRRRSRDQEHGAHDRG